MTKLIYGIERWDGLSALLILFATKPGAVPQAGMATGLWPSISRAIEIPRPPLDKQRRIVTELDAEAMQMEAVRSLLPRFEAKTQRVLDRVRGTASSAKE